MSGVRFYYDLLDEVDDGPRCPMTRAMDDCIHASAFGCLYIKLFFVSYDTEKGISCTGYKKREKT